MKLLRLGIASLLLTLPTIANAASPATFKALVEFVVDIMNNAISVLVAATIVIYFFGVGHQILKKEQADSAQMRKFLLMGIAIIFVMVSIWGILQILDTTLNTQAVYSPSSGTQKAQQYCNSFDKLGC